MTTETIERFVARVGREAAHDAWHRGRDRRVIAAARRVFAAFSVENGGGRRPRIFTPQEDSAKGVHNEDFTDKFYEVIHYGAPARTSGVLNMCTSSTCGCRASCLRTSGQLGLPAGEIATRVRTRFMYFHPFEFFVVWFAELEHHHRRAQRMGKSLVVRGNGTTDVRLEDLMPDAYFDLYRHSDYTKHYDRAVRPHPNLYVVKSAKERTPLPVGENVVVVVNVRRGDPLPKRFEGRRVVDGDQHDLRFLDPQGGRVVLVRAKGRAIGDTSGFVRSV